MVKRASIAKITRPRLTGVAPRERAFHLLDEALKRPITWVAAPAGSGKTTLVASWLDARKLPCLWYQVDAGDGDIASFFYFMGEAAKRAAPQHRKPLPLLTPEYLQSVPVFTRRYFEELFRRLKASAVLVLDNYQDAPQDSGFSEMISHALETVPEGINIIILGRANPPQQLARLQANSRLRLIGWEDVRFTPEESEELLKAYGHGKQDKETVAVLREKAQGWAAGLVLLMAGNGSSVPDGFDFDKRTPAGLFDYFASEIFSKTGAEEQDFLLKTAYFPWMTTTAAEQLTGNEKAGAILSGLNRSHYFTDWRPLSQPVFQYHPLFREFLQARAKKVFTQNELNEIQCSTAIILEQEGRIDEAAALYISAKDHVALARIIPAHGQSLVEQGRQNVLSQWLSFIPQEIIENDPWLLYWSGICRMIRDPRESRSLLEKAYGRFKTNSNMTGVFLSWASIIDTFVFEWGAFRPLDHWIDVLDELLRDTIVFPSPEIEGRIAGGMLSAITFRRHRRTDLPEWAERVEQMVVASRNVQLRMIFGYQLIVHYFWAGDFSRISLVIDQLRPSGGLKGCDPLTRQYWYLMSAMYSWLTADWKTCLESVSDGLKNAEESGIHQFDVYLLEYGVAGGLTLGDPSTAESFFEKLEQTKGTRLLDTALHHYFASLVARHRGKFSAALEYAKLAVKITDTTECHISQALTLFNLSCSYFELGLNEESDLAFQRGMEVGQGMVAVEFFACLNGAEMAFRGGKEHEGRAFLQKGLAMGARYGLLNTPHWNSTDMSRLCAVALKHGIETEYVGRLIAVHRLSPPQAMTGLDTWPWPVRIYTLDEFRIEVDSRPLAFSGKVQKKPLEMLKVLIERGGEATEGHVADILWPEADGDMAHNSFKMALSRLRNLIGKESLRNQDGRISLNRECCWVDALATK